MSVNKKEVILMDIDKIRADPDQPRTEFSDEDIASTAFTIESQGIINPIEVDEHGMIVTGEIRFRAAQMAGLKQVPVVVWRNGTHKRFERQVVENMHQHQLSDRDRENAIVKLWKTGQYPTMASLAKSVGLGETRIKDILYASGERETLPKSLQETSISTRDIAKLRGIDESEKRTKILQSVAEGKIKSSEIEEVARLAKTSDALLDKVLENKIPLQRATETATMIIDMEKRGGTLSEEYKTNLAEQTAKDEGLLEKYKDAFLEKVKQVTMAPKRDPRVPEPIGKYSVVQKMIDVKDEILDKYRIYLGNCDINEKKWAKKIMTETRDELTILIGMIRDD